MKRILFAAMATFALVGLMRADDLEDSYAKLKDSVEKKDADGVKAGAAATFKLAQAAAKAPEPSDKFEVDNWKQGVEHAKEIIEYTENVLAYTATLVEPAKTVELVDALLAQNPKSKYLDTCTSAYLAALGKSGAAKQLEGMKKIADGRPENEVALAALAEGLMSKSPDSALRYANTLIRLKGPGLATGYFVAGVIYGAKTSWIDCDKGPKGRAAAN